MVSSHNKYQGHRTFEYADDSKYIYEYVDGKRDGRGDETFPDDHRYEGNFKNKK